MLKQKVINIIKQNKLIENGDKIIVGVSGGPDSICLLSILNEIKSQLNFKIYVCHVNHCLRENALLDEEYVEKYCKNNNIEFFVKKVDVKKFASDNKIGTEEAGRIIRYDFFNEVLKNKGANKIATAHTANDNCETIIMNFIRGAGINGLTGIELFRQNKYIRPLLVATRNEIEEYCKKNDLRPRIDETNKDNIYTRNKIRNICIPYIENEFNKNIVETLNRTAEIVTEENNYIEEQVNNIYKDLVLEEEKKVIVLDLKKFNNQHLVIKRRIILYTVNKALGTINGIEKKNIDDIVKLCQRNIGDKYLCPNKNIKVIVKNKKIFFEC